MVDDHSYTGIQIRTATVNDHANIKSCAQAAYAIYVERMGREPAPMVADFLSQIKLGLVHVAYCGNYFVGYVVFYPEGDHLHLENIAVLPQHAGKGIGKNLIAFIEQTAREKSLTAVELYTNELMTENIELYAKLGYIETGRRQQDGFDRVFFRKAV